MFVRNLAFRADEGALAEFFAQCGEIVDLRLGRDVESGRSRGFCHVAYSTAEAAEKALALHETTFYGRDIVVQMAKSDEERNADRDRRREEKAREDAAAAPRRVLVLPLEREGHAPGGQHRDGVVHRHG